MRKRYLVIIIAAVCVLLIFAVVAAASYIIKRRDAAKDSEPLNYEHQDRISDEVWELKPDKNGRRPVEINFRDIMQIPKEELPDDINVGSSSDRMKFYRREIDAFAKRNGLDLKDKKLKAYDTVEGMLFIYADDKTIRKLAGDEFVESIRRGDYIYDRTPMVPGVSPE